MVRKNTAEFSVYKWSNKLNFKTNKITCRMRKSSVMLEHHSVKQLRIPRRVYHDQRKKLSKNIMITTSISLYSDVQRLRIGNNISLMTLTAVVPFIYSLHFKNVILQKLDFYQLLCYPFLRTLILERVSVKNTSDFRPELMAVLSYCPNLQVLCLKNSSLYLSPHQFRIVTVLCPTLRIFTVSNTLWTETSTIIEWIQKQMQTYTDLSRSISIGLADDHKRRVDVTISYNYSYRLRERMYRRHCVVITAFFNLCKCGLHSIDSMVFSSFKKQIISETPFISISSITKTQKPYLIRKLSYDYYTSNI